MSCDLISEQMVEFVLGDLSLGDQRRIEAHLRTGCQRCNDELHEVQQAMGLVFESIPNAPLDEAEVASVFSAVISREAQHTAAPVTLPISSVDAIVYSASFVLGLVLFVGLSFYWPISAQQLTPFSPPNRTIASGPQGEQADKPQEEAVARTGRLGDTDAVPRTIFTSLRVSKPAAPKQVRSMLLYDPFHFELHVYAVSDEPLPPGQSCWLVLHTGGAEQRLALEFDDAGASQAILTGIANPDFSYRIESSNATESAGVEL